MFKKFNTENTVYRKQNKYIYTTQLAILKLELEQWFEKYSNVKSSIINADVTAEFRNKIFPYLLIT